VAVVLAAVALPAPAPARVPALRGRTAAAHAAGARLDLHTVDWRDVVLPGAACDGSAPIALHDDAGLLTPVPRRWASAPFRGRPAVTVYASDAPEAFGDLEGAGLAAAALEVNCNNGGGTADSALLYSVVIFTGRGGQLTPLGVITPRVQPREQLPTLLSVRISLGRVTVSESFYGPHDPTCCSSGGAVTVWAYRHGRLIPGATRVWRAPRK
jgi:hypothetical protein